MKQAKQVNLPDVRSRTGLGAALVPGLGFRPSGLRFQMPSLPDSMLAVLGTGGTPMDALLRSTRGLDPPTCPNCHMGTQWYGSKLVAPGRIMHLFACPNCSQTAETETVSGAQKANLPLGA